jgi:hypothetical protein
VKTDSIMGGRHYLRLRRWLSRCAGQSRRSPPAPGAAVAVVIDVFVEPVYSIACASMASAKLAHRRVDEVAHGGAGGNSVAPRRP